MYYSVLIKWMLNLDENVRKICENIKQYLKQAAAHITGQLQVRPMLYTLYISINLTIIMKQYGDRQTDTNI